MIVTKKFSFDLDTRGISPLMYAVQGEVNTRKIEISLFSNGTAWEIPEGTIVAVAYRKPDGTSGLYDKLPSGEAASEVSGNVVTVMLAPQVLTCAGKVVASIIFYSQDMVDTLATFPFQIYVEKSPGAGQQSSNNYYALQNLDQVNAAYDDLLARIESLENSGSGITSEEKTLILTLFRNAVYTSDDMADTLAQLETLWNASGDSGDSGDDNTDSGDDTHTHSYTSSVTTAATCTTAGVRTYTCSCGHSYTEAIAATGHTYVDGVCSVCGAADPSAGSADPIYALENVENYEIYDRYNTASTLNYVNITNGNHVKISGDNSSANWYLNVNLSSLATNGQNSANVTDTWFTVPAGAECELKVLNVACGNWNTTNTNINIKSAGVGFIVVNLKDIETATERSATATATADTAVNICDISFMKSDGGYLEFDIEFYVNGERWI